MSQAPLDAQSQHSFIPDLPVVTEPIYGSQQITVTLSIYTRLSEVENDWRAFERHADGTVFQTFNFTSAYCQHVQTKRNAKPAIIVGRAAAGSILFLIPLGVYKYGGLRHLTFLGSELCDYNGPLLSADFSSQVERHLFLSIWREAMLRLAASAELSFDLINLEKMPAHVGVQVNPLLHLGTDIHHSGAYKTSLGNDWKTFYLAKRSSWRRKHDRARERKLAIRGVLRFWIPESTQDLTNTIELLIAQKTELFAALGVANIFERPGYHMFFKDLATSPSTRALVHISRLEVGASTAAVNFGLIFRGRFYHLITSYDRDKFARLGAGTMHLQYVMRDALQKGCGIFDFTVGDEAYKREWCDTVTVLYDHISSVTWKAAVPTLLIRLARRTKRGTKQTPWLLTTFLKLRASTAGIWR